ncbi:MAG TPA: tRNA lysidine(34) synthetase TilS [Rhodanobacteraceae bacterium]|nr:tRNA lysidine(34) synthetase TilS [Rhodanobacteraceae bacterium]
MDGSNLIPLLIRKLAEAAPSRLCVAHSGGADSTALLHALAQIPQARERGLRALHVDHGLHEDSARWAEHCRRFCDAIDVPIEIVRVQVAHERSEGIEAAARRARHAAFASAIQAGEWLALAHHRDDQVETVLLKLLRGAGPQGLGGMRELRAVGAGMLWRPLLDCPRSVLRGYVAQHQLAFIDDPSNADTRLSRNYLRAEIIPKLLAHWPHALESIAHSAELCREAAAFLDAEAETALTRLRNGNGTLDAHGWSALPDALRMPVLECWLHQQNLHAPRPTRCEELRRQIEQAREDREPCIVWPDGEIHSWRGALHAMPPLKEIPRDWEANWDGAKLELPGGAGVLLLRSSQSSDVEASSKLQSPLRVRFRRGGERIKPAGDAHTRELRDLLQGARIPPWQRGRIPLIFREDELLAVGDVWITKAGEKFFGDAGSSVEWRRNPSSRSP